MTSPRPARRVAARQKPIAGRCLVAVLLGSGIAAAQPPLGEAEAVSRGLARPAVAELREAQLEVQRSESVRAGLWPNPTLGYSREQTFGSALATGEDYAWLSQTFDLANRRGVRREAGRRLEAAVRYESEARARALAAEVRLAFHQVLYSERRLHAAQGWAAHLDAVLAVVTRREQAGDVSRYDRRRLERERAATRAQLAGEEATRLRARAALAGLMGDPAARARPLAGELLPPPPDEIEALVARLASRPEIRALDEELAAATLEQRAARRAWVPEPSLSAGLKYVDGGMVTAPGFVVGATLPLPFLDHGQADRLLALGRRRRAEGRRALFLAAAEAEVRGLWAELRQLLEGARRLRDEAVASAPELVRTAETGYAAGEFSILELLDAYRSAFDAESQALALELRARQAAIQLQRAVGDTP
jgi:cobalt-zinc-cadmium efflux system outer membrane protein